MQSNHAKRIIPWLMAAGRALLGPVILFGDRCGWSGLTLSAMVVTALLSDIFDGVLARRWRVDTAAVRLFDSMCDTAFYLCVGLALCLWQRQALDGNIGLLYALVAAEVANFAANFARFGRPASYHSYLAKSWGLVLAAAIIVAFASHPDSARGGWLMALALLFGIASNLETLAMSLMLPVWRRDVKTLREAWRIRQEAYRTIGKWSPQNASTTQAGDVRPTGLTQRMTVELESRTVLALSAMAYTSRL